MLVAVGLALAVGVPVGWWATRPEPSAGAPVLAPAPAPTPTPAPAAAPAVVRTRAAEPGSAAAERDEPRRIVAEAVDLDAPIEPAGVRPDGAMEIPADVAAVGWYRFGPAPGAAAGSAVLAGHVDSAEQGRGALASLRSAGVGDRLVVTTAAGREVAYRVTGRETIVKKRLPTERLFTRDGPPRLVIVTCGGPFLEELSSYRDNVVVVAEPEVTP